MSVSIAIRDFAKEFQTADGSRLRVLENVDLQVTPGEFVTILGPSGCGKSTLLNALSGLDTSFEGKVEIGRSAVGAAKPRIAYLFQEPRLLPWRTVRGNIEFALDAARVPSRNGRRAANAGCRPSASHRSPTIFRSSCQVACSSASPSREPSRSSRNCC